MPLPLPEGHLGTDCGSCSCCDTRSTDLIGTQTIMAALFVVEPYWMVHEKSFRRCLLLANSLLRCWTGVTTSNDVQQAIRGSCWNSSRWDLLNWRHNKNNFHNLAFQTKMYLVAASCVCWDTNLSWFQLVMSRLSPNLVHRLFNGAGSIDWSRNQNLPDFNPITWINYGLFPILGKTRSN